MDDNGFVITDSHAIVTYLIDKYANDDSLYPKDIEKRALVNQFLHFKHSVLFASVKGITFPLFFDGARKVPPDRFDRLTTSCEFLEKYLQNNDWLVGDSYTLPDQ